MSVSTKNQIDIKKQLKRTAEDSLIYVPAMVLPAIVGVLLIRILTTIFTFEEYGYYQITLSTFGLIHVFSIIWLSSSVVRFYLNHKNSRQEGVFFSTLFFSAISGAILIAVFCWVINYSVFQSKISPVLFSLINLAIVASVFDSFFEIFVVVFRAGLEPKKYSLFWILFSIGKPILGICLILWFGLRVEGVFWAFLIVPLLLDMIIFFQLNLHKHIKLSAVSRSLFKQFFRYGLPICFSFLAFWVLSLSDRYLVEYFRGSTEVGLYSVGYTISEKTLHFIYTILMLAAFPIIVDTWEKHGDESAQKLITELSRYFFLLSTPILIILVTIPKQVFLIFSSEKFIEGARVLPFIAIGIFILGLSQYILKGFELHKKTNYIAFFALAAGFSNIIANIILIPKYGFFGAGISACVAYFVYFVIAVISARKQMAWKMPLASLLNIGIASFVLGIFLKTAAILIDNILLIALFIIPSGVIIFYLSLIIIREITSNEIKKTWNFAMSLLKG